MKRYFWPMFFGLQLMAQTAQPPVLTAEAKLKFFKAQAESLMANQNAQQANQNAQQKQVVLQSAIKEMETACGAKYQVQLNSTGDPECVVKPEPKPEIKK